jgi:hypothetical protein
VLENLAEERLIRRLELHDPGPARPAPDAAAQVRAAAAKLEDHQVLDAELRGDLSRS